MLDKATGAALPQYVLVSSPPVIRAMANTLLDSNIDLLDTTAVITRLIAAGWYAREVEACFEHAVRMAMTRRIHERRANYF